MRILYTIFYSLFLFSIISLAPIYSSDATANQQDISDINDKRIGEGISISIPKVITEGVPFFVNLVTDKPSSIDVTWNRKSISFSQKLDGRKYNSLMMLVLPVNKNTPSTTIIISINGIEHKYTFKVLKASHTVTKYSLPSETKLKNTGDNADMKNAILQRNKLLRTFSSIRYWEKDIWGSPVAKPFHILQGFGHTNIYNNKKQTAHEGLDFSGKIGDPIYATASGTVAFVSPFYFLGKTIYINHGQGIFSGYSSLDSYNVSVGQIVRVGDIIGTMGRVTPKHKIKLHFALFSVGEGIDPTSLLQSK
ncbi:MAG: M23 family metallopeptidase [Desulfovibrionaceae bacterium]